MAMSMRAMILNKANTALVESIVLIPEPKPNEVLIAVSACGICRTDLHVVDGELTSPKLPLIPGHQIVGKVVKLGSKVSTLSLHDRIGIPWLGSSCQHCHFCLTGKENLCDEARYTGYQINGGFAEYCVANENYCFKLPENYDDLQVAPLLCAGLIGYRAYRKVQICQHIGIFGFGAAAHILTQVALHQGKEVYAFTRHNDKNSQQFALSLGAQWAGDTTQAPPHLLEGAIIFAPAGELVPEALKLTEKGGTIVCAGIHMSDIPSFPYNLLWGERILCSIANLTRQDGIDFLSLAPKIPIKTAITIFPLSKVNEALTLLRKGEIQGAGVIKI